MSGYSVSLSSDGSIVAIGACSNNGNGTDAGHVRVYENISGTWVQIGNDIDGEAVEDYSGGSVSLSSDGSVVAIGAFRNDGEIGYGSNVGHVRVYKNILGTWAQVGNDIDGEEANDWSGNSISLNSDGSIVAIGASCNHNYTGQVRVYEYISDMWIQIGDDIDGEASGDNFGCSVSFNTDGSVIAIGAYGNEANGEYSGHVRIYDFCGTRGSITDTVCSSYTSPSGDYTWTNSGTYLDIIPNAIGCDSLIAINLTIKNPYQNQQLVYVELFYLQY